MNSAYVANYYVIFHKIHPGVGEAFCVVQSEEVAAQFCRDFPDYYYLPRSQLKS